MTVALVTCDALPDLDPNEGRLLQALTARGISTQVCIWNDPLVNWSAFDLAVIRSTWDYTDDRDGFVAWAQRAGAVTRLCNPAQIVAWNTDKRYLRDLERAGVPVVPTMFLEPGSGTADARARWAPPPGASEYVIKPAVSAGSRDTSRYVVEGLDDAGVVEDSRASHDPRVTEEAAAAHVQHLLSQDRVVMIQPYLSAVDTIGETALIFIDGTFSHAIRKGPMLAPGQAGQMVEGLYVQEQIDPRTPTDAELATAAAVLAAIPGDEPLLYARVDVVPDANGDPLLLELELTEPSLFFAHHEPAAHAMAEAIARRLTEYRTLT